MTRTRLLSVTMAAAFCLSALAMPTYAGSDNSCFGNSCNGGGSTDITNTFIPVNTNSNEFKPTNTFTPTNTNTNNANPVNTNTYSPTNSNSFTPTNTNTYSPTNTNVNGQAQGQLQGQKQQQQQSQQQQQNQTQGQSQSLNNDNQNYNAGNTQSTVFNDRLQAPAVSSFIAASGPCTGISGGAALSFAGFGGGLSFASLEEDCKKRELLRIGFASGNAAVQAMAVQGWEQMYKEQFGGSSGTAGSATTASLPVTTTTQVAQAPVSKPAKCTGANRSTIWYSQNCAD